MDYNLKFIAVGDCAIGKSCLVITASTDSFPTDYIPKGTEHYATRTMYHSLPVSIGVTDTDSREDNDWRRILYYPYTNVFLACFSMVNRNSFENIKTKWIPEITKHCPNVPIILVGCKYDLVPYSEPENVVTQEMIEQMVKTTVASASIVTSSKSMYNIDKVFPLAIDEFNNNSKSEKIGYTAYKKFKMPPEMPPVGKFPCIYVEKSNFGKGFEKLLDSDFCFDTKFVIYNSNKDVDVEIKAHSLVLACVPSKVIGKLFDEVLLCKDAETNTYSLELFEKLSADINGGKVSGFSSISIDENESHVLKFRISNEISHRAFRSLLEIQYYGQSSTIKKKCQKEKFLDEVKNASTIFKCKYTNNIVDNYQIGERNIFNDSIETHLNNFLGCEIKKKYFDKKNHSDVEIIFSDSSKNFHGHKLFLSLNCHVFRTMFEDNFVEHSSKQVDLSGEIGENVNRISEFNTLFEYLYSGHSTTINENNAVGLLSLANEYGLPDLTSMCEVFISQSIEKSLTEGIEKVDIDIIGLLLLAQTYEANQLAKFCLHFISTNFESMKARKEWNLLTGDNLKYVTENKWPPDSYLKQVKKYEKKNKKRMKKKKSNNEYNPQFDYEIIIGKKKCFIQ